MGGFQSQKWDNDKKIIKVKFIIIPVSYRGTLKNSASERFRCDWLLEPLGADKYDGSQNLDDYDVIIYQKAILLDLAHKYKNKIQIFDVTDPLWLYNDIELIRNFLTDIRFTVASSPELAENFRQHFPFFPVETIIDRHDFTFYKGKKKHTDLKPSFVWFGYSDNFSRISKILPLIAEYDLTVICEKPVGYGKFIAWDINTVNDEILKHDIAINILDPIKLKSSNNKTVSAWALGLPVVEKEEDVKKFLDYKVRKKEAELRLRDLDKYDIKKSAEELLALVEKYSQKKGMKVLVSVPNTGWIHKQVVFALLKLIQDPRVTVILPTNVPFENNLHLIINDFMAGDWDYWLSIDSDNPPIENPLELLDYEMDIIGLPTPVWHNTGKTPNERPLYYNAYDKVKGGYAEHKEKKGLQEVDAIGTGCFLISRRVFENKEMRKGCFTRKLNKDGTVNKGNDISFCERAKKQGFRIFCHYDYPCMHFNELELNEVVAAFRNLYKNNG